MSQALQNFLSCRDEYARVTGTIAQLGNLVHIYRNGQAAGAVALAPADVALLMAYELPAGMSNPIGWYIAALSRPPVPVAVSTPAVLPMAPFN